MRPAPGGAKLPGTREQRGSLRLEPIDENELSARAAAFDAAAESTVGIDTFCSSTDWILPARRAFHPESEPLVLAGEHGFAALAITRSPTLGRVLTPLEAMWGLACPVVGTHPRELAGELAPGLIARAGEWDALWLCGLGRTSPLFVALASAMGSRGYRIGVGPTARRHTADLRGGFEGWLGRRSPKFRANLRRALRRADDEGLVVEPVEAGALAEEEARGRLFERIMAIEAASWKGLSEQGVDQGAMRTFYELIFERMGPTGRLRVMLATLHGEDVAYLFGGLRDGTFRGLQVSFDDRFRELSPGNVMQAHAIRALCDEGVRWYDLGSDVPYKARWAEGGLETSTLAVLRR